MGFLEEKETLCKCPANKGSIFSHTYDTHYGNAKNKKDIDILILLEFKEVRVKQENFLKLCKHFFNDVNYVVIPALGCTPDGFSSQDTINTYKVCKDLHIKKIIKSYNPKCIITTGRAIYTITESKDLRAEHFFIPVGEALLDYQIKDSWMYSPEFGCKVFPIPALYQWIENSIKDVYEYKFTRDQFQRALTFLNERPTRKRVLEFIMEEDPNKFLEDLISNKNITAISVDIETSGLNYFEDQLYTIQFSYNGISGHFCYFEKIDIKLLIQLFDRKDIVFIFQNGQFDVKFLIVNKVYNARNDFDTMLAANMLNENSPDGLKPLTWVYTEYGGYENELKTYLKTRKCSSFLQLPINILLKYGCYDAIVTYQIYEYFLGRFEVEEDFIKENFYEKVMAAVPMIIDVEMTGVQVDLNYVKEYTDSLKKKVTEIEEEIYKINGAAFNLRSSKELSKVLRKIDGFTVLKDDNGNELVTKLGYLKLNKETLERYEKESNLPFMKKIIEYNHLTKEISQIGYYDKAIEEKDEQLELFASDTKKVDDEKGFMASMHNGRLHGGYKLNGTATGRMSGGGGLRSTVNWQNMPGTINFRKMFLPGEGCVMAFSDYDAMEVSIFSQISGPGVLEDLTLEKKDMHCYTMVKLLELVGLSATYEEIVSKTKVDGQEDPEFVKWRKKSKGLNFSALYGSTSFGIANMFEVSKEEGQKFLEAFYESYPEVANYMEEYRDHAKRKGWVKTLLGRKRRLPQLTYIGRDSFRNRKQSSFDVNNLLNAAINAPVQGTSGQTTLLAMVSIWKIFKEKKMKTKILVNVHDEIVFEIPLTELEEASKIIKECMELKYYENVNGNKVRLFADIKYGEVWKFGYGKQYWDEHPEEFDCTIAEINRRNRELKNV